MIRALTASHLDTCLNNVTSCIAHLLGHLAAQHITPTDSLQIGFKFHRRKKQQFRLMLNKYSEIPQCGGLVPGSLLVKISSQSTEISMQWPHSQRTKTSTCRIYVIGYLVLVCWGSSEFGMGREWMRPLYSQVFKFKVPCVSIFKISLVSHLMSIVEIKICLQASKQTSKQADNMVRR